MEATTDECRCRHIESRTMSSRSVSALADEACDMLLVVDEGDVAPLLDADMMCVP
jgi:hypothetical protein